MSDPLSSASRREFLQATSITALSGLMASAASFGDDVETLKVAVVGCGSRGCELIRALTTIEGVSVVAVCDIYGPHLERGWQYAGPFASSFANSAELLDESRPDAVVIATPLDTHFAIARAAVEQGCAVYCEKLMCYSLEQARQLAAACDEHQTVFQVGLQMRANAVYRQAAAMVQTGLIGRIVGVECHWHRHTAWRRPVPVPRDSPEFLKWDRELNWWLYPDRSHGLLAEFGSHQFDLVQWILGVAPQRVNALGGLSLYDDGRKTPDHVVCLVEYELTPPVVRKGSSRPTQESSTKPYTTCMTWSAWQGNAFSGAAEIFYGETGTLRLSPKKGELYREASTDTVSWSPQAEGNASLVTAGKTLVDIIDPWTRKAQPIEILPTGNETRDALVAFVECVRTKNRDTLADVHAGLANTRTTLLAQKSLETRTWQEQTA